MSCVGAWACASTAETGWCLQRGAWMTLSEVGKCRRAALIRKRKRKVRAMEARVAGVPEDEESGLLPRPAAAGRRPSSSGPRYRPPPQVWATVDGPLGLPLEEAEGHARSFFLWGFACLPFLWAINCCYFWPVLRSPAGSSAATFAPIRPYVVQSAIGFTVFSVILITWATTFIVGGERLFGPVWNDLVMYNVADKLGISGFMG